MTKEAHIQAGTTGFAVMLCDGGESRINLYLTSFSDVQRTLLDHFNIPYQVKQPEPPKAEPKDEAKP